MVSLSGADPAPTSHGAHPPQGTRPPRRTPPRPSSPMLTCTGVLGPRGDLAGSRSGGGEELAEGRARQDGGLRSLRMNPEHLRSCFLTLPLAWLKYTLKNNSKKKKKKATTKKNLPSCSRRAKPTSSLLTSNSNPGGPQPHTGHPFLPGPLPGTQMVLTSPPLCIRGVARWLGSRPAPPAGHHASPISNLETCNMLGQG